MVKFDDVLRVEDGGVVVASGPFDPSKEEIVEVCAWVFKRDGTGHAAATGMTHRGEDGSHRVLVGGGELAVSGDRWRMELGPVGKARMTPDGDAFAVGVALIEDKQSGSQEVMCWGHPVGLTAA